MNEIRRKQTGSFEIILTELQANVILYLKLTS